MRICSFASGSSGNCVYAGSDTTHILIDAGCSKKKIVEGLNGLGPTLDDVSAILLTHEHSDHIGGLKTLRKHCAAPLFATRGTLDAVGQDDDAVSVIAKDMPFTIGDVTVTPFHISHDAAEPVCFRVAHGDKTFVLATDMGCFDDYTAKALSFADALMIEANHDVRMLQTGPYPYMLKQRILSDRGHLSNDASGELLTRVLHDRLQTIMLGHLSECNNLPELAYETVRISIEMDEGPYHGNDFRLIVADRKQASPVISL